MEGSFINIIVQEINNFETFDNYYLVGDLRSYDDADKNSVIVYLLNSWIQISSV